MVKVLYANHHSSDMLYVTKTHIADPTFLVDSGRKKTLFLDQREYDIFKNDKNASHLAIQLLDPLIKIAKSNTQSIPFEHKLARVIFEKYKLFGKNVSVPASFPLDMADFLRSEGAKIIANRNIYPERRGKTSLEVKHIASALKQTQKAYKLIEAILKESKIKGKYIYFEGKKLTTEHIKHRVDELLISQNLLNVEDLIISSGPQAAIPHHLGKGPLLANETIICDIFPRDRSTGYFADMTRTYVKGTPSPEVTKMYTAVLAAQKKGLEVIKAGISVKKVHQEVSSVILDHGFDVGEKGFIHGTGHGLGLDIHEDPYIRATHDQILQEGDVVTVEPGLYYPSLGGVRIEDVVLVTKNGNKNLTNYPKRLQIK